MFTKTLMTMQTNIKVKFSLVAPFFVVVFRMCRGVFPQIHYTFHSLSCIVTCLPTHCRCMHLGVTECIPIRMVYSILFCNTTVSFYTFSLSKRHKLYLNRGQNAIPHQQFPSKSSCVPTGRKGMPDLLIYLSIYLVNFTLSFSFV